MPNPRSPLVVDQDAEEGPPAAVRAVAEMVRAGGGEVYTTDAAILLATDERPEHVARARELSEYVLKGFFKLAAVGHEFVPREGVKSRFGNTIAGNYPEAGPAFLRFANSYWTLKLLLTERPIEHPPVAYAFLHAVEGYVGPLFFPTPGPIRVPAKRREADQRRVLQELAPEIDVDEFIRYNPILRRDRLSAKGGCVFALGLGGALAGLALIA